MGHWLDPFAAAEHKPDPPEEGLCCDENDKRVIAEGCSQVTANQMGSRTCKSTSRTGGPGAQGEWANRRAVIARVYGQEQSDSYERSREENSVSPGLSHFFVFNNTAFVVRLPSTSSDADPIETAVELGRRGQEPRVATTEIEAPAVAGR